MSYLAVVNHICAFKTILNIGLKDVPLHALKALWGEEI
jgi:hypothetical protein